MPGKRLEPLEFPVPGDFFPDSRTRHGTPSGWTKHMNKGEDPCELCCLAKSAYDERRRNLPENRIRALLSAQAQGFAHKVLRDKYRKEYEEAYAAEKARLLKEAGLKPRKNERAGK